MAGSYKHIVNCKNEFIGVEILDHLGDAYEALEECHAMIRILAGGDLNKIFEAQRSYVAEFNPACAEKMTYEDFWNCEDDK